MKFSFDNLQDYGALPHAASDLALNVAAALAIFFVGKWIARALVRVLRATTHRARVDETLADFLASVAYGLAIALIVIAALGTLGLDTTSAAAVVGGAALAIGLSLQSQIASFAAGVIIILQRPFSKGDYVEVGGIKGTVEEIQMVSTQLRTQDNKRVIVPNSSITTQVITNYTALGTRRVEIVVSASHAAGVLEVKALLAEALAAEKRVLDYPAATVRVRDLTPVGMEFDVWAWAKTDDIVDVRASIFEAVKLRFDAAGIELAAPDGRARAPTSSPAAPKSAGADRSAG
jgi:small conductance mechanosensitive channel